MRTTYNNRHFQPGLDFQGTSQCLSIVGRKERGYAHKVRLLFGNIVSYVLKSGPKMVIPVKHGEGAGIRVMIVFLKVGKLRGEGNCPAAMALVVIFHEDFHVSIGSLDDSLEHAEPQRLEPDVCVVKVLNGRLDEQDFHMSLVILAW